MAQALTIVGAGTYFILGLLHGVLTLRDVFHPRAFTPTDDSVREAMAGTQLAFGRRANLWRAWLGFNLSHSMGLVVFGGGVLMVAWIDFGLLAGSAALQAAIIGVAAVYLGLALAFWFWGPVLACGLSLLCFTGAVLLS